MANSYHKGQTVTIYTSVAFRTSGVATDPTTVTLKVEDPSGTESTYTYALGQVTKTATGAYSKEISLTTSGIWHYAWYGTGAVAAVDEGYLEVLGSVF